jgi:alpha-glucosidase
MLAFYRAMIAFRKAHPALVKGEMEILGAGETWIDMIRAHEGARIFCAFNLSDAPREIALPEGTWHQDKGAPFRAEASGEGITLPPWQAFYAIAGE